MERMFSSLFGIDFIFALHETSFSTTLVMCCNMTGTNGNRRDVPYDIPTA